jgi:hypothetical protein
MEPYIIILIIIIIISIYYIIFKDENFINYNDKEYFAKFKRKLISNLESNNELLEPKKKENKILIITYDNRINLPYIKLHNQNLNAYVKKWGFEYKFLTKCTHNVYWCKMYMVLEALKTNTYDYVMWMDSDTYIFNKNINLSSIVNIFDSDIFLGSDNNDKYDITNAGVFIIKNSKIGIQYLEECIKTFPKKICTKNDGTLKGKWAATCYEQGIMNILVADKYQKYTTILPNSLIYNKDICDNKVFIMHLYASSNEKRLKCFTSKK